MSMLKDEEVLEVLVSDTHFMASQELKEEAASLEQQRRHLNDQRALLDIERAELQQQMTELELQYAFLNALSARLDQQEVMLVSDAEVINMTGKRLFPHLSER